MKAKKPSQTVALLFVVWVFGLFACNVPGKCTVGNEADCSADTYCEDGKGLKVGNMGVCTHQTVTVIDSFSPLEASHGATLSIQGKGFSTTPKNNAVTLNDVPVTVVSATSDEIKVTVPKNMHCTGLVQVTVTDSPLIADKTATSAASFIYVPTAIVSTFAGGSKGWDNGIGTNAQFDFPVDIAIDTEGNLYVADANTQRIRKISPISRAVNPFAGGTAGANDGIGTNAQFNSPAGLAVNATTGNLYVADYRNHRIRIVSPTQEVNTFAGGGDTGLNNGSHTDENGTDARFNLPDGITIDTEGNLYVADSGNNCIRKVSPAGEVTTLSTTRGFVKSPRDVASFNNPNGIAVDKAGNLYVADSGNNRILKVSPAGEVSTFAGSGLAGFLDGPGSDARFRFPHGMAVDDRNGYLYVVDAENNRIRMVTPAKEVRTLAGGDVAGRADGIGINARFNYPHGIAMDAAGNLYVADSSNDSIRKMVLE